MSINVHTAAEQAYEELRRRIIAGDLEPLSPLPLDSLARELGVSTTPVRSALSRLETDGLVVYVRHKGATVAPLDLEDVQIIQAVRTGVEGAASRLGAPRLDDRHLDEMARALRRLQAMHSDETEEYLPANWHLRDICYLTAGRPKMMECIQAYRRRAERYIRLVIGDTVGFQRSIEQQTAFFEACRERNGAEAERVIRQALQYTVDRLTGYFEQERISESSRQNVEGIR